MLTALGHEAATGTVAVLETTPAISCASHQPGTEPASTLPASACGTWQTCPATSSGPAGTYSVLWGTVDLPAVLGQHGPAAPGGDRQMMDLSCCQPRASLTGAWKHHGPSNQSRSSTDSQCLGAGQSCWTAWPKPGPPAQPYPGSEHSWEGNMDGNKH